MKTIKAFIAAVVMMVSFNSVSQDRVNRQPIKFDTSSVAMTSATGWSYNATLGEWIEYKNVICSGKEYQDKYKSLQGQYMMSRIDQNFNYIQVKKINFNSKAYYALIVEKWDGAYQYPSIKEDWYEFKTTNAYIFTEEEFKKLNTIGSGVTELKTKIVVSMGSKYTEYNETEFLALIQTQLTNGESYFEYVFTLMKSTDGSIRFFVPKRIISDYDKRELDFSKQYFEVSFDEFSKIIIK